MDDVLYEVLGDEIDSKEMDMRVAGRVWRVEKERL
jgi:hypothetical protein